MNQVFYFVLFENGIRWSTSIPAPSEYSARTRIKQIYPHAAILEVSK